MIRRAYSAGRSPLVKGEKTMLEMMKREIDIFLLLKLRKEIYKMKLMNVLNKISLFLGFLRD